MNRNFAKTWETLRQGINTTQEDTWIRVGMDSGGIAAGAERLCEELVDQAVAAKCQIPVRRVGSYGYAFADPLVEVKSTESLPTLYGRVDEAVAATIISEHVSQGKLLDDHIIGSRQRGKKIIPLLRRESNFSPKMFGTTAAGQSIPTSQHGQRLLR